MRRLLQCRPVLGWSIFIVCQAALVTALLWPALRSAPHALPTSAARSSITVPLFNAWTIWWNADRLSHGMVGYWDAPIFFPERGAFAYSDPQPATLAVCPWIWMGHSPIIAYDAYLWLSLLLNALAAGLCLRALGVGWLLTFAGATAMVLLPVVWDNLDVVQLVPLWGSLLAIHGLVRFHRRPSLARGLAVGAACACVFFTSVHHGLFLVVSGLPACVWLLPGRIRWAHVGQAAAGALLLAVATAPLLAPMARIHQRKSFRRSLETQTALSATLDDWWRVPPRALAGPRANSADARALNPGLGRCLLAAWAAVAAAAFVGRRTLLFLLTLALCAFLLSLGTHLAIGSWQLWPLIVRLIPPLDSARSLFRFAYFGQLAIILLATLGAESAVRALSRRIARAARSKGSAMGRGPLRCVPLVGALVLGIAIAWEVPPPAVRLIGVPTVRTSDAWVAFLKEEKARGPILCIPFAEGYSEAGLESSAKWMLWATAHQRPLINGYSGFFPPSWFENVRRFQSGQWSEEQVRFLESLGVSTIVVDTRASSGMRFPSRPQQTGAYELRQIMADERGIQIWRLSRSH